MTYQELCEFEVLYNGFLEARKRKTKKPATAQYEAEVLENTQIGHSPGSLLPPAGGAGEAPRLAVLLTLAASPR